MRSPSDFQFHHQTDSCIYYVLAFSCSHAHVWATVLWHCSKSWRPGSVPFSSPGMEHSHQPKEPDFRKVPGLGTDRFACCVCTQSPYWAPSLIISSVKLSVCLQRGPVVCFTSGLSDTQLPPESGSLLHATVFCWTQLKLSQFTSPSQFMSPCVGQYKSLSPCHRHWQCLNSTVEDIWARFYYTPLTQQLSLNCNVGSTSWVWLKLTKA